MNKLLKNNKIIFLFVFLVGLLIISPSLIPSYNIDGFCTLATGYLGTAKVFMKSGRIFTALAYWLAEQINLSPSVFSILSLLFANLFLSFSVYKIFAYIRNLKESSASKSLLLLLGTFLIIYNPLVIELLLFEEAFIMCLGILLTVLASIEFLNNSKKSKILSLLLVVLGCTCYQGVVCFYVPIIFMLLTFNLKGNLKKDWKDILKNIVLAGLFYGISLIISFITVKVINSYLYVETTEKLGHIDIFQNIKITLNLIYTSYRNLFGFVNVKIFYMICVSLGILTVLPKSLRGGYNWSKTLYLALNILLFILIPFVANLGMNSAANYTAARMACSICSVVGVLIIYGVAYFDILERKVISKLFVVIALVYFIYNSFNFFNINYIGYKRYIKDKEYIEFVHNKIFDYEENNNIEVKNIKYGQDAAVSWVYDVKQDNSYNYRVCAIFWAIDCALDIGDEHSYNTIQMTEEEKNSIFGNVNYDKLSDEQFVFKDDTLYMLVY